MKATKKCGLAFLSATVALILSIPSYASVVYDLRLPGIGSQIPVLSYSLDVGSASLTVARDIDEFSTLFASAVSTGTVFPTGSLDTYDSAFSQAIPITSFVMIDVLITANSISGVTETTSLHYETGRLVGNSVPEPSSLWLLALATLALVGVQREKPS